MHFNELEDKHCYKLLVDSKYVNPLVRPENGEVIRISKLDKKCQEKINAYLNADTDLYFYIDYED